MKFSSNRRSEPNAPPLTQQTSPPQSTAAKTTEALWFFHWNLVVTVFQDLIGNPYNTLAEMKDDAQKEGTILSVARVDVKIVNFDPMLCKQWKFWQTASKPMCRLFKQEYAQCNKQVAWYNKMVCRILWDRRAQQYRRAWYNGGKEMYHSTNASWDYMGH